jgi:hypothetical protein
MLEVAQQPFPTPVTVVNATGFGPTTYPPRFVGVPFNPFNKAERLGAHKTLRFNEIFGADRRKEGGACGSSWFQS